MLNIRLPAPLEQELAQEAQQRNTSRSEVAREALTFYLRTQRRKRYIKQLQRAAERLDEAETRAFAEEGMLFDNESLGITEASPSPLNVEGDEKWWQ